MLALPLVLVCGWSGWPLGRWDVVTGSGGWSGHLGGQSAGGFEQAHPVLFAVPSCGQVQGDLAAAAAGGTGGDSVRSRRSVAPLALAQARPASDPAARSRLWLMAAQASQAPLAGNEPDGRCASGPSVQSAKTCSAFWFLGEPEPLSLALSGSPWSRRR